MPTKADQIIEQVRASRVWRSVFRSGTGNSTLHRALAIQQNIFLHLVRDQESASAWCDSARHGTWAR